MSSDDVNLEKTQAAKADRLLKLVEGLNRHVQTSNESIAASNARIAESNERIGELGRAGKRNKHMTRALAISVLLDVALSVGLGITVHTATTASDAAGKLAQTNKNNAVALCVSNNQGRAVAHELWTTSLDLLPGQVLTPEQQATRDRLQNLVDVNYAPRSC